ncbi:MAG: hypothetical protein ABIH42_07810 [Planctomycetota bacterium]
MPDTEKKRKSQKRDSWYLAVCTVDGFQILDKDIIEKDKTISTGSFPSRKSAFFTARKIPGYLDKNAVHIIRVSDRLIVKRRETIKVTIE